MTIASGSSRLHSVSPSRRKAVLLAGVSLVALSLITIGPAKAADIPQRPAMVAKAPATVVRSMWNVWVEGGALKLDGDPGVAGMNNPPFDVYPKRWGWEAALGADYRSGMGWLASVQVRYAHFGSNSASNSPIALFQDINGGNIYPVQGTNTASRKEHRWVADFMVGRELGLGRGQHVGKFGVRVAEIRGKTTGLAGWDPVPGTQNINCATAPSYCGNEFRAYSQTGRFIGAGPRVELSGAVPMAGPVALEYMAGVAGLYGRRSASQTVNVTNPIVPTATPTPVMVSGGPIAASHSSYGFVFNVDALLGFSVALAQNVKLTTSYRFDGYFRALGGFDSQGNAANLNRFYHGPMLRVTVTP
jgi:hypothetical protein